MEEQAVKNQVRQTTVKPKRDLKLDFWMITVIRVLVIFLIIGGSYLIVLQSQRQGSPSPQPIISPTAPSQPPPIDDETANWKTYKEEKYGIEFEYPPDVGEPIVRYDSENIYITFTNVRDIGLAIYNYPYTSFGIKASEVVASSLSENSVSDELQSEYPFYSEFLIIDGQNIFVGARLLGCEKGVGSEGGCNFYLIFLSLLDKNGEQPSILSSGSSNLFNKYSSVIGGEDIAGDILRNDMEDDEVRSKAREIIDFIMTHNEISKMIEPLLITTFKFTDQESAEGRVCGGPVLEPCPTGYVCQTKTIDSGDVSETSGECVKEDQVVCTQDAKLCPDGKTYVGRQGPNCEFAPCP